jgi:hypothetical protein
LLPEADGVAVAQASRIVDPTKPFGYLKLD